MAIEGKVRVTPEQLKTQASEVDNLIRKLEKQYSDLDAVISKTSGYWVGDAGDLHRKKYTEGKEKVNEIIKRWKEHPKDLLTMAGLYDAAEKEVEAIANSLPADVIS